MYRSVSVFVLFALLASAIAKPHHEEFKAAKEKCVAEVGIDAELVKGPPPEGPIDDKLKCFGACMMKDLGVLKEGGTLDVDKAISYVPADLPEKDKVIEAINTCADKKGDNDCDTAHEIFTCFHAQKVPHFGMHHH